VRYYHLPKKPVTVMHRVSMNPASYGNFVGRISGARLPSTP